VEREVPPFAAPYLQGAVWCYNCVLSSQVQKDPWEHLCVLGCLAWPESHYCLTSHFIPTRAKEGPQDGFWDMESHAVCAFF
jgi:hypothetical protein